MSSSAVCTTAARAIICKLRKFQCMVLSAILRIIQLTKSYPIEERNPALSEKMKLERNKLVSPIPTMKPSAISVRLETPSGIPENRSKKTPPINPHKAPARSPRSRLQHITNSKTKLGVRLPNARGCNSAV